MLRQRGICKERVKLDNERRSPRMRPLASGAARKSKTTPFSELATLTGSYPAPGVVALAAVYRVRFFCPSGTFAPLREALDGHSCGHVQASSLVPPLPPEWSSPLKTLGWGPLGAWSPPAVNHLTPW
jgi:hypothetical protein